MKVNILKILYTLYTYVALHLTSLDLNKLDRKSCTINFQISEGTLPSIIADENSKSVEKIHRLIPPPNNYFQETICVSYFSCLNLLLGSLDII